MANTWGRSEASAYIGRLPKQLTRLLQGAAKAGGQVIATEAKQRSASTEVADAVVIKAKSEQFRTIVRVTIEPGWAYSRALWLEYGTSPHFISISDKQRQGVGLRRINAKVREADGNGSLVIGGQFVGGTVFHPGARAHPFLRPALDIKQAEAVRAAQRYIDAGISRGMVVSGVKDDDE